MKRVLVALMVAAVLPKIASAQQTNGRITFDYCYTYPTDDGYTYWCNVYALDPGGFTASLGFFGFDPAVSPDGTRVAFVVVLPFGSWEPSEIAVVDLRDGTAISLVGGPAFAPAWSRDGGRIAFEGTTGSGIQELYVANADGTNVRQVTNAVGFRGYPTWAPDDRIAFQCLGQSGRRNLCSINADGTGFRRLTDSDSDDAAPAFSPDGTRIAFQRNPAGATTLEILNSDGTVTSVGGLVGYTPAWSPDGTQLAFWLPWEGACPADGSFCGGWGDIYLTDLNGTNVVRLSPGGNPSWSDTRPDGFSPTASFTITCNLLTCTFDASSSSDDGTIVSYAWRFEDGTTATGTSVLRTYSSSGTHTVNLEVEDDSGMRGMCSRTFDVTDSRPIASFTRECTGLTCRFDASASSDSDGRVVAYAWSFGDGTTMLTTEAVVTHSYAPGAYNVMLTVSDNAEASSDSASTAISVVNNPPATFGFSCDSFGPVCVFSASGVDSDGTIVAYAWDFGDGTSGVGSRVTHTYAAGGTYGVTLTVTNNYGATNSRTASVTVVKLILHVGDLDGTKGIQRAYWTAFVNIRLHDADHLPVNARVDGIWSTGESAFCYADTSGTCNVATVLAMSAANVTFTVHSVSLGMAIYDAARNHDVDGETNGTSITIRKK